jgi:hypothetical protein
MFIIVALTSIVINSEEIMNKDITDLRMNITVILKDIEENCSALLMRHPTMKNLPNILPTCWRAHGYYRYAKFVVSVLIIHDSLSGGPVGYLIISTAIAVLSIFAVYVSKLGLLLLFDFGYIAFGFIVVAILHNKCFVALPPEPLHTS